MTPREADLEKQLADRDAELAALKEAINNPRRGTRRCSADVAAAEADVHVVGRRAAICACTRP